MDFGLFYLKKPDSREKALTHFEQAYMIYDSYFEKDDYQSGSEIRADAAIQVASLLEEQNRLGEAAKYVGIAYDKYLKVFQATGENTIIAQWLKLQIAYSRSNFAKPNEDATKQGDNSVLDQADKLQAALRERDNIL